MITARPTVFDLPDRLAAKRDPHLIGDDERHFAELAETLERSIAELSDRVDAQRKSPGGSGQSALERDLDIHRMTARLRTLRRFGVDLCLGRVVATDGGEPVYIGRLGLVDDEGTRLLVDWRSPAAEPFFGATHANPMGLASRRRYRWSRGRVTDYWDEVFTSDGLQGHAALDDQSAFIASLASTRSERMRDVLGTIQADQDAIIRAGSHGALVVDGGPGTGKTVVALHRAAYLLYSDPRLKQRQGGVLFVGPHQPYLSYVSDVLPGLGEDGVEICTLRDLVPEGAAALDESEPQAALKSDPRMVGAVEAAVRLSERPPRDTITVETPWAEVELGPDDWAEAFDAADRGIPHNEARDEIRDELVAIITDRHDDEVPAHLLRRAILHDDELTEALTRAWPLLDPAALVARLWSDPALLQRCAPWLSAGEVRSLQRDEPRAWTTADLPLLDAARLRIGDPHASVRRQQREAALAEQREQMDQVVDELIASQVHDDGEGLMTMLRGGDVRESLIDESAAPVADPDSLAGPFAHIVVDEAQELTDAQWQMLLRRCPSRSFTIVGDRAQARHGFTETWQQRLERIGLHEISIATLTINYRTPSEVMAEAEPVIRALLPDANVPTSVRSSGVPVRHGSTSELASIIDEWVTAHPEGVACVIGDSTFAGMPRVRSLTPELSKGLEFDLVVLVDPERWNAVDRYVAMTRATQRLVVLAT